MNNSEVVVAVDDDVLARIRVYNGNLWINLVQDSKPTKTGGILPPQQIWITAGKHFDEFLAALNKAAAEAKAFDRGF